MKAQEFTALLMLVTPFMVLIIWFFFMLVSSMRARMQEATAQRPPKEKPLDRRVLTHNQKVAQIRKEYDAKLRRQNGLDVLDIVHEAKQRMKS